MEMTGTLKEKHIYTKEMWKLYSIFSEIESAPAMILNQNRKYHYRFSCSAAEKCSALGIEKKQKLTIILFR